MQDGLDLISNTRKMGRGQVYVRGEGDRVLKESCKYEHS